MNAHNEQQYPASAVVKQNLTTQPAAAQEAVRKPDGYHYRYPTLYGTGTCIRQNNGEEVNGSKPIEAVPYWYAPVTAAPGIDLTPFRVPVEFWRDVWRGAEDHFGEPDSRVAEADRLLALIDASHKGGSDCETCNGRGIFDTDGNGPEEGHRCGGTAVRTRNHDWIDTNSMTPLYSFQVYADGRWRPPHIDGKPLLFKTEAERDKARAEARAKKANSHGAGVHHD